MAYKKKGIDISRYQGTPDFTKVKNEVDFVLVQAGYGKYSSQKDISFTYNMANCKKNNIPVGAYWYSYARSVADAHAEAKACLEVIRGYRFEYPIYIDLEENLGAMGMTLVSNIADAFCSDLEAAGYFAGIYISRIPAQSYLTDVVKKKYALWLAEYGPQLNYSGPVGIWQYSSKGRVSGISGDVDMNYAYEDYPTLMGDKNDGVLALKQLLIIAHNLGIIAQKVDNNNSFGEGTEKAVNEYLKTLGKNQNGIAGANFITNIGTKIKEAVKK